MVMTRRTGVVSLVLVLAMTSVGLADIDRGLAGHWRLNGDLNDSSGNDRHGRASGTAFDYLDRAGRPYAARFNGSDHTIRVPHSCALKPRRQITLAAWIRPSEVKGKMGHHLWQKEDGNDRHLFAIKESGAALALGLGIDGRYDELHARVSPRMLMNGAWHFVAATYDGSAKRIYLNGQVIAERAAKGAIGGEGDAAGYIGSSGGDSGYYAGDLADVRMYDRALSSTEIMDLYCLAVPNLIGHWRFDGTLKDGSPMGIDGVYEFTLLDWAAKPTIAEGEPIGTEATYVDNGQGGKAVYLNGRSESVKLPDTPVHEGMDQLTLSTWFLPEKVDDHVGHTFYRKEKGNENRQMFKIGEHGSVIAFGLTLGGQWGSFEAKVTPEALMDGRWHLATATYDGSAKRVYLDGELIGQTERSGRISDAKQEESLGPTFTFIGSSCGKGEFFKGALDDLRMYDTALTTRQIRHMAKTRRPDSPPPGAKPTPARNQISNQ